MSARVTKKMECSISRLTKKFPYLDKVEYLENEVDGFYVCVTDSLHLGSVYYVFSDGAIRDRFLRSVRFRLS